MIPHLRRTDMAWKPGDETEYRIEFQIQRRRPGDEDFTEIGFGSSGAWGDVDGAMESASSYVQNYRWETSAGMPDPDDVKADCEADPTFEEAIKEPTQ